MTRCIVIAAMLVLAGAAVSQPAPWQDIELRARGQTVNFNAWGGDEQTNAFIQWAGDEVAARHGVKINHVKLRDTAEAVTRVVAEKAAGRNAGGSVDLVWINGPNFLALKQQGLLYGPFAEGLPNYAKVDTTNMRSNVVDFTIPVDGMESPWRRAQIVFVIDGKRVADPPRSVAELLSWAKRHPGRLTHPSVRNFLGVTFLKQALYELAGDRVRAAATGHRRQLREGHRAAVGVVRRAPSRCCGARGGNFRTTAPRSGSS